jgi:hypothetical protein
VTPARVATVVAAFALLLCGCDKPASPKPAPSASASSAAPTPCTPRSAEKLGFPFVRICPPGEAGFWINAAPMGCSAGEHDSIRCPQITALSHAVRPGAAPLPSTMAAVIDKDTAARLCFMRMGGHLATRAERSKARAAMGLATVLVTESDTTSVRFHFDEVPEWVFEESGEQCANALPGATCHFGWFPAESKGPGIPWPAVRSCQAQFHEMPPAGVPLVDVGGGCPSVALFGADAGAGLRPLPCGLRSPAFGALGVPSTAAFTLSCAPPVARTHPEGEDKDTAAYRCVLAESALGTFDVPGR